MTTITDEQSTALAERIARVLFRNGLGHRARRLVLELENGKDGGGWCKQAVIDQIEKILRCGNCE